MEGKQVSVHGLKISPPKEQKIFHDTSRGPHQDKGINPNYLSKISAASQVHNEVDINQITFEDKVSLKGGDNVMNINNT